MTTKKIVSIAVIIAMAAMFFSSSAFVNPSLAKTTDNKDKSKDTTKDDPTTSTLINDPTSSKSKDDPTASTSSSAKSDFKEFQKCLFDSAGTKGFATNKEIKACYNPIFHPVSSTTSPNTVKPIDFSSPFDFTKSKSSIKLHNNDDSNDHK